MHQRQNSCRITMCESRQSANARRQRRQAGWGECCSNPRVGKPSPLENLCFSLQITSHGRNTPASVFAIPFFRRLHISLLVFNPKRLHLKFERFGDITTAGERAGKSNLWNNSFKIRSLYDILRKSTKRFSTQGVKSCEHFQMKHERVMVSVNTKHVLTPHLNSY